MATRTKQKAERREKEADKRPHAFARHIRISPYKVRSVIDLVRGKTYNEAAAILINMHSPTAEPVKKVMDSAAANAEQMDLSKKDLYVAEIFADQGPTLKRMLPRARGSADRILSRTCHITVILDSIAGESAAPKAKSEKAGKPEKAKPEKADVKKPAVKKPAAKKPAVKKPAEKKATEKEAAEKPVKKQAETKTADKTDKETE